MLSGDIKPAAQRSAVLPLWAGRSLALVGIVLLALNLRTAVAAISPIVRFISDDIPLDNGGLGIIGMLPPIAFAASAILAPTLTKRLGLESSLVWAIIAAVLGHLARSLSDSYTMLLVSSLLVFAGMGIGNVLLPPLVKRYFPDRIGLVTSLYATMLAVGTTVPALLAVPIADDGGWRLSLGVWSGLALLSLLPWIGVWLQQRGGASAVAGDVVPEMVEPPAAMIRRIWHSRTAWALATVFAVTSFHVYAMFAWFPELLIETADQSPLEAGVLLALYSAVGFPLAIVIPMLTARMKNISALIYVGAAVWVIGYLGLMVAPTIVPWLWTLLIRGGSLTFPVCLVLINLRTRTPDGAVALSAFVQAIGYTLAALGPLLVGLLHGVLDGWVGSYLLLLSTIVLSVVAGFVLRKPSFIEDELALVDRRAGSLDGIR